MMITLSKISWIKTFLIITAFLPFLGLFSPTPDPLPLIYSLFVLGYLFKEKISTMNFNLIFPLFVLFVGLFTEALAWGNNYFAKRASPALFHPQLIFDLLIGVAMYGAWAFCWGILIKRFRYSILEVFTIQGLYGVLLEQKGLIFIQGLLHLPLGFLMWLYVFVVYGSIIGLAFILAGGSNSQTTSNSKWTKYPLTLILLLVVSIIMLIGWGWLVNSLGWIPKAQPIWQRPFW